MRKAKQTIVFIMFVQSYLDRNLKMAKISNTALHKKGLIKFLLINLVIAIVVTFLFCPICFSSFEGLGRVWKGILYSFSLSTSLSGGISWLEEYVGNRISWFEAPGKRLMVDIVVITIYASAVSFILTFIFHWSNGYFTLDKIPWDFIFRNVLIPVLIAYCLTAFFMSRAFLFEWRQAAVDAEKLRAEQFAGKYRMLRDQLNPHFLFNSLNVLSNIVYEDADRAADFIQQLSRFYRYVLEVQKEELVPLEKEIDFADRYLKLQQLRFGENLKVEWKKEIPEGAMIPPLSLQLLLENAVKHNEISNANPLKIVISVNANFIKVENAIQKKVIEDGSSTGVGLENIKERYRLLCAKEVKIQDDGKNYKVELPILKMEEQA